MEYLEIVFAVLFSIERMKHFLHKCSPEYTLWYTLSIFWHFLQIIKRGGTATVINHSP